MPHFYEISDRIAKCGVASVTIVNTFFIFLTVFHIRGISGTYKTMIIIMAVMGILLSILELLARPFVHNYNKGWIYFSLNSWMNVHEGFLKLTMIFYSSFYIVMLSHISVQFLFRYLVLVSPKTAKKFTGKGILFSLCVSIFFGVIDGVALMIFGLSDEYSDEYMMVEMLNKYELAIKDFPRFIIVIYGADGSLRYRNVMYLVSAGVDVAIQYLLIIFCGIKMHLVMNQGFKNVSVANKKIHKQFLRALIVQTIVPTVLFVFPAVFVLLSPILDLEMSFQTGWIYALISMFPSIDSIGFMYFVSEYRKVIKKIYLAMIPEKRSDQSELDINP